MISDSGVRSAQPPAAEKQRQTADEPDRAGAVTPVLAPGVPLCVDLDGTLVKSDTLVDSVLAMARQGPSGIVRIPSWIAQGKAQFKKHVTAAVELDVEHLPYNRPLLEWLRAEHGAGRAIYLATAADRRLAERVADFLGIFAGVLASDGETNLAGKNKLEAFRQQFGERFCYIGNAKPDVPLLAACESPMTANPHRALTAGLRSAGTVTAASFEDRTPVVKSWLRAIRLHQWAKNTLIFVPLLLAHAWTLPALGGGVVAFFSFGLCASATYIINDLLDIEADRRHPRKRRRPFAAGDLSAIAGVTAVVLMMAAAFVLAVMVPRVIVALPGHHGRLVPYYFLEWLALYTVTTLTYSLYLKRTLLLDVFVLSGLYTVRILAGSAATTVPISEWLGAFSVFFFLSLDLPNPPIYAKVNPADAPILTLALSSDTVPLQKVEDLADTVLAQKISQLSGVGLVSIAGGQKPAVRIQANPAQLASYGLSLEDIRTAIGTANVDQAKGSLNGPRQAYTIGDNDQLLSADDYKSVIVAYRNNSPVRLSDVANVVDSAENLYQAAWMGYAAVPAHTEKQPDGTKVNVAASQAYVKPAIIINIQRQPGANIIGVVDEVQSLLPKLRQSLPAGVDLQVLTDRTNTIRASVKDVQFELMLTIVLVVVVIFLFLRSLRATFIPAVAVPLSIVGTFGIMYLLGYSLNNLSLMALTISTGFVVDDAIVMIENIDRYLEMGDTPLDAALKGSEQIGFTILSLTVSLIAVLIPLLFMGDIVGRLFREFAVTLAATILVSAVVSLTLTPMLSSLWLKHTPKSQQGKFYRKSEEWFEWTIAKYGEGVQWVLRHQTFTLIVTAATLVLTLWLYYVVPKGFFPSQDTGVIMAITEGNQSTSFSAMTRGQQEVARTILQDPDVVSLSSYIGIDNTNSTLNSGRIQIDLKDRDARKSSALQIINRLQGKLNQIPGIQTFLQPAQDLTVEDRISRTQYQYSVEDPDPNELASITNQLVAKFKTMGSVVTDVASDQQINGLGATLVIDRDTASRLGVTPSSVDNVLDDAFAQRQVSTIFTQQNQYHVIMEVAPNFQRTTNSLDDLYVKSSNGGQVPLTTFTTFTTQPTSLSIGHQGQFPSTTISFNLAQGKSIGDAVDAINKVVGDMHLPQSVNVAFQGTAAAFEASLANEPLLILAALVVVYIVLGVLYESYIHPVTILSTLPSAGVGAILALLITGNSFSVIALIGVILLIGIVKKNAIMMIDFALEAEREQGMTPEEAIYQACLLRFRPIMMTTMAALLGAVPLAFGSGTGSELRAPLGITIIGGLLISQVLTLFTTPVVYLFFDRIGRKYLGTAKADEEFYEHTHGGKHAPKHGDGSGPTPAPAHGD